MPSKEVYINKKRFITYNLEIIQWYNALKSDQYLHLGSINLSPKLPDIPLQYKKKGYLMNSYFSFILT